MHRSGVRVSIGVFSGVFSMLPARNGEGETLWKWDLEKRIPSKHEKKGKFFEKSEHRGGFPNFGWRAAAAGPKPLAAAVLCFHQRVTRRWGRVYSYVKCKCVHIHTHLDWSFFWGDAGGESMTTTELSIFGRLEGPPRFCDDTFDHENAVVTLWSKETPPGGFPYLLCSLIKNRV